MNGSGRSRCESRIRSVIAKLTGVKESDCMTNVMPSNVDILVVNTNYLTDWGCMKLLSEYDAVELTKPFHRRVANQAIACLMDIVHHISPKNVVVVSDGAFPYALRKGVLTDNCNAQCFHLLGEGWAGGKGWERPYPNADLMLGAASSAGSMAFQQLHEKLVDLTNEHCEQEDRAARIASGALHASNAYVGKGDVGPSMTYIPHTECGSWESKTHSFLSIANTIIRSETGSDAEVLVLDSSSEMFYRLLVDNVADASILFCRKGRVGASGSSQTSYTLARVNEFCRGASGPMRMCVISLLA